MYLSLSFAIVFFGGYYAGYNKGYGHAETRTAQRALPPVALVLPEPAYADAEVFEPQPPLVIEPGADIDVDRPDDAEHLDESGVSVVSFETTDTEPSEHGLDAVTHGASIHLASLEVTPGVVADAADSELASNASSTEASYSIQVGMYSSSSNAGQLLETLKTSGLDAYIDEYSNERDESRFNVRFGFYRDRASAKAALAHYRSQLAGEGYVVRVDD